jgi:hypothetical protein
MRLFGGLAYIVFGLDSHWLGAMFNTLEILFNDTCNILPELRSVGETRLDVLSGRSAVMMYLNALESNAITDDLIFTGVSGVHLM